MLYKVLILTVLGVIFLNVFLNIITTVVLRFKNPLKKLPCNKKIYLTFDDGIHPIYTKKLLDILKKYNIKASFFILSSTLNEHQDILKNIQEDGHIIALHSFKHKNQIIQDPFSVYRDYKKSINDFAEQGITIKYHRPTYGHISFMGYMYCKKNNLNIILWNVIVKDWQKGITPLDIQTRLNKKIYNDAVICLHDGRGKSDNTPAKTITALNNIIPQWIKEGYSFEKIDTLY